MKTRAKKSSTTTPATRAEASRKPFFARAGTGGFFPPAARARAGTIQPKLAVNKPGDKFEQEADRMALQVMRAPAAAPEERVPGPAIAGADERQRKAGGVAGSLQRAAAGAAPALAAGTQSAITGKTTGGQPLPRDVRSFMEPRFGADFSEVRIHADAEAASLSNRLSARAFTYQNHVFFAGNQYQPGSSEGKQLLAHELTHTIQQGYAIQRSPTVSVTSGTPTIQRLGVQDALDYFADKAYYIPGFRLLTIVLGFNPISGRSTDRSAANILRGLIELMPGGYLVSQALDNHGVFTKAGAWVEQQLAELGDIGADISGALERFLDSLSWSDIFHLGDVWDRAKAIFTDPVGRLIAFAEGVVSGLMSLIKEAILRPLAAMAEGTAGYDLLKAVLGQDPITGDPVPRTADTLIGGFMKLIGQEEIWENIKKGNAIARAWAWFQDALAGLMAFVTAIPGKIVETLASITWQDVITIVGVFRKVGGAFLDIAGRFFSWAGQQVISLLEIIFTVVAPGAVPYIKKAKGAFETIIRNPVAFVGNLVRAGKLGFQMFASRIGQHLKAALINWLVGPLGEAGVYIPKSFSLLEIVKLVLSVLGLTWQNIRGKLVRIIPEPVLAALEKTAGILVTLVRDGPAAAWEQIQAELSELKETMVAQITTMVTTEVVKAAVVKLVSMLNPAGAVIQAIIAIYNTVTFFIQKIRQIAGVVASIIDSIAAIAAGSVESAAMKVEQTMKNTLTVVIAFLAKFAGIGNIPQKVVGIINKIRQPIDKALDKIVAWLGKMLAKATSAVKSAFNWLFAKQGFRDSQNNPHTLYVDDSGNTARLVVASSPMDVAAYLSLYKRASGKEFIEANKEQIGVIEKAIVVANGLVRQIDRLKNRTPPDPGLKDLQDKLKTVLRSIAETFLKMKGLGGKTKMEPAIRVVFDIQKEYQKEQYVEEFARQIGMQEARINTMRIKEWLVNRHIFVTQGRTGDTEKDKARRAAIASEVERLQNAVPESPEVNALRKKGITRPQTIKEKLFVLVKGRLKGQAVLHTVDQVAGGSGTEFGDEGGIFGSTRVNSSLGSQWTAADRIGKLEKSVAEISPAVYPTEKMKVKFEGRRV